MFNNFNFGNFNRFNFNAYSQPYGGQQYGNQPYGGGGNAYGNYGQQRGYSAYAPGQNRGNYGGYQQSSYNYQQPSYGNYQPQRPSYPSNNSYDSGYGGYKAPVYNTPTYTPAPAPYTPPVSTGYDTGNGGYKAPVYNTPVYNTPAPAPYTPAPAPTPTPYTPPPSGSYDTGNGGYKPPVYNTPTQPPVYQPPVYTPPPTPTTPTYPTPTPPPTYPPVETPKMRGSAGLFGDPKFGLFSNIPNAPAALKEFQSNIGNGQTVTLLNDPDKGGFRLDAKGVQVDPSNPNTTGIGQFSLTSGNQSVQVLNNGTVNFGGQTLTFAQLKQQGGITLDNGASIGISNEIDGANGQRADRFSFQNGEYKFTAALRSPHPDSKNYFDMNFEELTNNAADNATGYNTSVAGLSQKFGIAEMLRLEQNSFGAVA